MKASIEALETIARQLEPSTEKLEMWTRTVRNYGLDFIRRMPVTKAFQSDDTSHILHDMDFSEDPRDLHALLDILKVAVDGPGINPASGGHLGYIPGGGLYPSALADFLADITNRYAGIYFANPGAVRMENILIAWMAELIGYPTSTLGNLTSGGSIANLAAITTARDAMQITWDRIPDTVIYLTGQTHHCVHKAIRIAGLGQATLRQVRLDDHYRMDASHLEMLIKQDMQDGLIPFLIVASIGSTDTGAVDPIGAIGALAKQYHLWFHVDAAYGGFFVLIEELKHHFSGLELSDSYVVDPHKGLFLPYGTGAVLVKDGEKLRNAHYYKANYMQDALTATPEESPADLSAELTKHFRGLRMWLPLQLYGLKPFRAALKEKWLLCRYFYRKVQTLGFETGPEPELSVAIYRYVPPEPIDANTFNRNLLEAVQKDGTIFISSTTIDGVYWIRLAVLSFRTHLHTIDTLLHILERERDRLLEANSGL